MRGVKIRRDCYSLYIRVGGYLFRPIITQYAYPLSVKTQDKGESFFDEGMVDVRARHLSGSPFAKLALATVTEYWHSHGCDFGPDGKNLSSESCWRPMPKREVKS